MWANTCWGLFGLAVTSVVSGLPLTWTPQHALLGHWLLAVAAPVFFAASLVVFLWPFIGFPRRGANAKLVRGKTSYPLPRRAISLRDAAILNYQKTRAADALRWMIESIESQKIDYHVNQIIQLARFGRVVIRGRTPPSQTFEPISIQFWSSNPQLDDNYAEARAPTLGEYRDLCMYKRDVRNAVSYVAGMLNGYKEWLRKSSEKSQEESGVVNSSSWTGRHV